MDSQISVVSSATVSIRTCVKNTIANGVGMTVRETVTTERETGTTVLAITAVREMGTTVLETDTAVGEMGPVEIEIHLYAIGIGREVHTT